MNTNSTDLPPDTGEHPSLAAAASRQSRILSIMSPDDREALARTEQEIARQITAREALTAEKSAVLAEWSEKIAALKEHRARVQKLSDDLNLSRDWYEKHAKAFATLTGTADCPDPLALAGTLIASEAAFPRVEKKLAELRAEEKRRVADVRAFIETHHVPRDAWPALEGPNP